MRLYLAGSPVQFKNVYEQGASLEDCNILQSFVYCNAFVEDVIIPTCRNFMLDSGAFTFKRKSTKSIDWVDYTKKYADFINKNNVEKFFELDIDSVVGLEDVEKYRKLLESLTGRKSIPVWHKSRGKKYFEKMCKEYNYVSVGGIVGRATSDASMIEALPYFSKIAHENGAMIHGLGCSGIEKVLNSGLDSSDSSSWLAGVRFGQIAIFDGSKIKCVKKPEGKKTVHHKKIALHAFTEWKKYAKYLETA